MKFCSVKNCNRKYLCKKLCGMHYQRRWAGRAIGLSAPLKRPKKFPKETWFWSRVKKTKSCWLWLGAKNNSGYGTTVWGARTLVAHRVAFKLAGKRVPAGFELDHLCRRRNCVRVSHLEPVTHRVNVLRGKSPSALHAKKTHCPKGHPYRGKNLRILKRKSGSINRICRACSG